MQPFGASHAVSSYPELLTASEIREFPIPVRVTTVRDLRHSSNFTTRCIDFKREILRISTSVLSNNFSDYINGGNSLSRIFVVNACSLVQNSTV
jgi:hypothetical protein